MDKRLEAVEIIWLIIYGKDVNPGFMTSATKRSRVDIYQVVLEEGGMTTAE